MTWKGTLRTIAAAQRRAEREARKRRRELEKLEAVKEASQEVETYENYLDVLRSVHKEAGELWDWAAIKATPAPSEPERSNAHEAEAQARLESYTPGTLDRMLGREESKREHLRRAVSEARQQDDREYQQALKAYEEARADWDQTQAIAIKVLAGDVEAYARVIEEADPFSEVQELGTSVTVVFPDKATADATVLVEGEGVIPKERKSLLKSGRVSVKPMPKTQFYELYQDYVAGCVLRVARELFALLPIESAVFTATANLLNTQTGHLEEQPIISAVMPRETVEGLNFDLLDPSDALANFVHEMQFRKTKGFGPVERVKIDGP